MLQELKEKTKELGKKVWEFANEHKASKGAFFLYGLVLGYITCLF